jgi:pimeloyl-ACP methyl ester carboxylesterase
MGSSLGGYLAALYAARHPRVRRVVLLAPAFGFAQRWPERLGPAQVAAWRDAGAMEVFHYADNRPRQLGYQLLVDGARYEAYPDFAQPALIFHGAHDDAVPVGYSEEFAVTHRNATLEVLDSGHDLLDVLDYMAPKIAAFLAG